MEVLAATALTFTAGLGLVPAVRALARRLGMVAAPRKDRWHSAPTALLGGVGIFAAFALGLAVFPQAADDALPVLLASALMFVVGLVDDVVQLRPVLKLGLQVVAALMVVGSGIHLPWTHDATVDGIITLVWLVGITNAVNLLDNMDGLAAGIAAIASVFLSVTFLLNGQAELAVLPALLCGAAAGFLVYNFKPASVFMGDGGSMFLGSLLGGLALLSSYGRSRSVASVMMTPVLIMMIPILDTTLVTITRRLRGQPVSLGGRDHTSHRLVALGASERRAVVILYLVAAASGAVAVVVRGLGVDALLAVIPGFALAVLFFALYLGMVPVRAAGQTAVADGKLPTPRLAMAIVIDAALFALVYVSAFAIRWDWSLPVDQRHILATTLPFVVAVEMAILWAAGMYRVQWHQPSVEALTVIARSVVLASAAAGVLVLGAYALSGPSRGALVLNGILLLVAVVGSRLSVLVLQRMIAGEANSGPSRPVLVYGAAERASFLVREMLDNPDLCLRPVAVVGNGHPEPDRILGIPVLRGGALRQLVEREGVHEVLVPSHGVDRAAAGMLQDMGLRIRTVRLAIE